MKHEYVLPVSTKVGDECPYCINSAHTGVYDKDRMQWLVCKVCGDRGVIDKVALSLYGAERREVLKALTKAEKDVAYARTHPAPEPHVERKGPWFRVVWRSLNEKP